MACNCKANEKILELGMKYGSGGLTRKQLIGRGVKHLFRSILGIILVIILSPIIFLYLIGKGLFSKDKTVSIKKILNLKKNVREQQNIQTEN